MQTLTDAAPLLSAFAALLGCAGLILGFVLYKRLDRFARPYDLLLQAAQSGDTNALLQAQIQGVESNKRRIEETLTYVRRLRSQALNSIQGVGFKRYDAFDDIRGQQSFSLCLLDAHLNGVMITSIAGRSDSRAYAKPIRAGKCEMVISEEEAQVLDIAKESLGEVHEPVLAGV